MPGEGLKKRVRLMGKPCVLPGAARRVGMSGEAAPVLEEAEALELLALLVLGREFLPPEGVRDGGEVRRDWLAERMHPDWFADGRKQKAREKVRYHRDTLQGALGIRPAHVLPGPGEDRRERNVVSVGWDGVWVDVLALRGAAAQMHAPQKQDEVIALADRPLLEGMDYVWLQEPPFQKVRVELDTYFLTALARQADSQVFQMEKANEAGRFAEADACRTKTLPLLDKAAERLDGYGILHYRPEYAALAGFEVQFSDLRRRASYPLPDTGEADGSPDAAPLPPAHNLPSPVTSFVGREQERRDIRDLLTSGRLVTLTGMGGCGKTRLAVQAAWETLGDWEGVRLVELAALTESDRVPQAIAAALGVTEQKGVTVAEALITFLQDKRTLLLLDNCEHLLLDERSDRTDCGTFAAALLHACPTLSILATSRKPLNIDGEHLCPLSPLPFPAPDFLPISVADPVAALLGYDAAQLFVDRALQFRRFTPGPENVGSVAAICAALDGIPLALELAAARVKALPLERIAEMLSDRFGLLTNGRRESPSRHKTLRAVIDWSFDLLNASERGLFCRLSVFAGGWTLNAAEAVGSSEDLPRADVLNLLESLVDKSLVIADLTASAGRYRMLETVRQYAQDRLRERAEWEETHHKHRDFFVIFAEKAEAQLRGPEQRVLLDQLEAQIDDLRIALSWCLRPTGGNHREGQETGLRLVGALGRFWNLRGYFTEGRQWLETAIEQAGEAASPTMQAKTLGALGTLISYQGEHEMAAELLERSLMLWRQLENKEGTSISLNELGLIAYNQGKHAIAETLFQESLQLRQQINDKYGCAVLLSNLGMIAAYRSDLSDAQGLYLESLTLQRQYDDKIGSAITLHNLANLSFSQGDYETATALFGESLALSRQTGHKRATANSLCNLGGVAYTTGDYKAATAYLNESLTLMRQTGEKYGMANTLNNLAEIALHQQNDAAAKEWYEESLILRRQLGDKKNIAYSLNNLGNLADTQGRYTEASALFHESLTLMRQIEDKYGIAFSLEGMGSVFASSGQAPTATKLWGAAESLREATDNPPPPHMQKEYHQKVSALRTHLGDFVFTESWAEGQAMSWEQAVAVALGEDAP